MIYTAWTIPNEWQSVLCKSALQTGMKVVHKIVLATLDTCERAFDNTSCDAVSAVRLIVSVCCSFGVVLYELITEKEPWGNITPMQVCLFWILLARNMVETCASRRATLCNTQTYSTEWSKFSKPTLCSYLLITSNTVDLCQHEASQVTASQQSTANPFPLDCQKRRYLQKSTLVAFRSIFDHTIIVDC